MLPLYQVNNTSIVNFQKNKWIFQLNKKDIAYWSGSMINIKISTNINDILYKYFIDYKFQKLQILQQLYGNKFFKHIWEKLWKLTLVVLKLDYSVIAMSLDEMAAILQMIFSNAFPCMKMYEFFY